MLSRAVASVFFEEHRPQKMPIHGLYAGVTRDSCLPCKHYCRAASHAAACRVPVALLVPSRVNVPLAERRTAERLDLIETLRSYRKTTGRSLPGERRDPHYNPMGAKRRSLYWDGALVFSSICRSLTMSARSFVMGSRLPGLFQNLGDGTLWYPCNGSNLQLDAPFLGKPDCNIADAMWRAMSWSCVRLTAVFKVANLKMLLQIKPSCFEVHRD